MSAPPSCDYCEGDHVDGACLARACGRCEAPIDEQRWERDGVCFDCHEKLNRRPGDDE
jgi:hypothetical protein